MYLGGPFGSGPDLAPGLNVACGLPIVGVLIGGFPSTKLLSLTIGDLAE